MSDVDIATLKDTQVSSDHPGQTFVNAFGEGGRADDSVNAGRENLQDTEYHGHWFMVHRPPANDTFGVGDETELVIQRIGADDVIVTGSKNREIESQARAALGRDFNQGEVMFYTGDGTGESYIDIEPDGTITMSIDSGGGDTATIVMEPSTGNIDLTTSGTVRIGGATATDYGTLFTALKTQLDVWVTTFNSHKHNVVGAQTDTATTAGFTQVALTTAARATKTRQI